MIAYLDSSALVKLVKAEDESPALREALGRWPDRASSWLLYAETMRAARRLGEAAAALARSLLADVTLVPIGQAVIERSAELDPEGLRTLDAIHVATALELGDDLGVLVAYHERMLTSASALGLETLSPH